MGVPFEVIEHPADVGFLAYGRTLEELFSNAALAMLSLACEPSSIEEQEQRELRATGTDVEALLFSWLAEILAVADAEQLAFRRVEMAEVELNRNGSAPGHARGIAYGEPWDKTRHRAGTYIKAVTYHQLEVRKAPEGWRAQVYLDV